MSGVAATASAAFLSTLLPTSALAEPTASKVGGKPQFGDEEIMTQKGHGTSAQPVQSELMYGVSNSLADRICNFNRHFAEQAGYFKSTSFAQDVLQATGPLTFYDSVTGKPLFVAPIGRSPQEFLAESALHGWPSFRDQEVVWENVRVLRKSGETVSVDGTHLGTFFLDIYKGCLSRRDLCILTPELTFLFTGHNLPDRTGNRYCINLVSVAGRPSTA